MSNEAPFTFAEDEKAAIINAFLAQYPFATQAQAEAGVANNVLMNPLATAQAIAALGGGGYLEYVALLTQIGTNAPVATVLTNTLGGTPVWARSETGIYTATLPGAWVDAKTVLIPGSCKNSDSNMQARRTSADVVTVYTLDIPFAGTGDGLLLQSSIIVRVYA